MLKITKKQNNIMYLLSEGHAIPKIFFEDLFSKLSQEYIIYNVHEQYFHNDEPDFQAIKTNKLNVYYQKVMTPYMKTVEPMEELYLCYLADNVAVDGISFEEYKDYNAMETYQHIFVVKKEIMFSEKIYKDAKEVLEFFKSNAVFQMELYPDGGSGAAIYFYQPEGKELIDNCLSEYNNRTP